MQRKGRWHGRQILKSDFRPPLESPEGMPPWTNGIFSADSASALLVAWATIIAPFPTSSCFHGTSPLIPFRQQASEVRRYV